MTKAEQILKEIERMSRTKFLPIVGPAKGRILADAIRSADPKRVLEVGTLIGYSAILIGKELGREVEIITIEIHGDEAKDAEENIARAEIAPKVEVIMGDALQVIPKLREQFDAVFIDAEKTEYMDYLRLAEPKLHKGTVIVADNAGIFADQMRDYLSYVRTSGKYTTRFVPVGGDGLEISVKL